MSQQHCSPTFDALATSLGFSCQRADGLVEVRNPLHLENWTLPVLEFTVVLGAVLTLVYAIVRLRRHGDPTNLVVWVGAVFYLFIIEPPLYFPAAFHIQSHVDTMFAHNVFTVDFLWGRLPLYIVAIYPMMATLAFEIVRALGVFRRRGVVVGAVCVGFVNHAFYEVFDHLGPQRQWWEWSVHNWINQPMFDAVPLPSVVVFAALWPMSLAFFAQLLVGRQVDRGTHLSGLQITWRAIAIGILASIGTAILPFPASLFSGPHPHTTMEAIMYAGELVIVTIVAVPVLFREWRNQRRENSTTPGHTNPLVAAYGIVYLVVMAALWVASLPAYFDARHGLTPQGTPTGNLGYTFVCFVVAAASLAAMLTAARRTGGSPPTQRLDNADNTGMAAAASRPSTTTSEPTLS